MREAPRTLRTTIVTVHMHVHGTGFLGSVDRDLTATRQFGFGLR